MSIVQLDNKMNPSGAILLMGFVFTPTLQLRTELRTKEALLKFVTSTPADRRTKYFQSRSVAQVNTVPYTVWCLRLVVSNSHLYIIVHSLYTVKFLINNTPQRGHPVSMDTIVPVPQILVYLLTPQRGHPVIKDTSPRPPMLSVSTNPSKRTPCY